MGTAEDGEVGIGVRVGEHDRSGCGVDVHPGGGDQQVEDLLFAAVADYLVLTWNRLNSYSPGPYFLNPAGHAPSPPLSSGCKNISGPAYQGVAAYVPPCPTEPAPLL